MRIGLLLPSVYMGSKYKNKIFAPKELFIHLADGLVDRGHEVYVYASENTKTKAKLIPGDNHFIEKDFISPKYRGLDRITKLKNAHVATRTEYEIDLSVKAYEHATKKKVQLMHSYHDFMAHYVNKLVPIPTVYTLHDPKPLREHLEYRRLHSFKKDNYIFISESQLKTYHGLLKSAGVIRHGVDINKFKFGQGSGNYLAFLGRYIQEKGVTQAILASEKTGKELKMVGDDAYRALNYYQKNILPKLKKGKIEDISFGESQRDEFLKEAKALLFPILWDEPFGMVMIEAMSTGTPVIAYNRGSVTEVIKDGLTGFIVEHDHGKISKFTIKKTGVEGLAEAINRIYEMSEEDYGKMRLAARKHVEENFTIDKMVEEHEKVYKKIID